MILFARYLLLTGKHGGNGFLLSYSSYCCGYLVLRMLMKILSRSEEKKNDVPQENSKMPGTSSAFRLRFLPHFSRVS